MQKKDVFFIITTACNLHCFSCGYGCQKDDNPWYITEEDFKNTLIKLKDTQLDGCSKYVINITGGDALLHPNWLKLALLTREILPDQICFVATNGILFNKISDEDLVNYVINFNIRFGISLYPSLKLLPMYESLQKRFERLNIDKFINWNYSHFMFGKISYKDKNSRNILNCFDWHYKDCDYIYIFKNKIYNCQDAFVNDKILENINNYIYSVEDISNLKDLKNIETKQHCKNCKISFEENILWQRQDKVNLKDPFISLKDLYVNDYEKYYILQHDCKEHLECLKNDLFKKYFTPFPFKPFYDTVQTRFFKGKIDLFIPFDNYISEEFKNILLNQTIINNCNLYFISITNDKKVQEKVYNQFYKTTNNVFFLKANSFMDGLKVFFENSYLDKKYCLDINNYNQLNDTQFLEKLGL